MFPGVLPELEDATVRLRALSEADIPGWFARASDAEAAALAGDPVAGSIAQGAAWLARHRERFRRREAVRWAIVPRGMAESVGTVGLGLDGAGGAELGFVVGRAHWGRGIGGAAAALAVGYGFSALGLREIRAEVLHRNAASLRILAKLGFSWRNDLPHEACAIYLLTGSAPTAYRPAPAPPRPDRRPRSARAGCG